MRSGPGSDVEARACLTAPSGTFSSSSQTVDFRNGLSANNYNGHRTGTSSDETTVFQTSAGAWHVITDTDTARQRGFPAGRLDLSQTHVWSRSYGRTGGFRHRQIGWK